MLVFGRKENETIEIAGGFENGGITVTVLDIRSTSIRIAIEAPRDITIHRGEIQSRIDGDDE